MLRSEATRRTLHALLKLSLVLVLAGTVVAGFAMAHL